MKGEQIYPDSLALLLSFFSVTASILLCFTLALFFALAGVLSRKWFARKGVSFTPHR